MWIILKINKKYLNLLKLDLTNKLDKEFKIYNPKVLIKKFQKNKILKKEVTLLGDYMFCFHKKFSNDNYVKVIKNCKGLKYILNGHIELQREIVKFIDKCKSYENESGYIRKSFYDIDIKKIYKFSSGPFADKIFTIIKMQQSKIDILIGNLKTSVKKQEFLFTPI